MSSRALNPALTLFSLPMLLIAQPERQPPILYEPSPLAFPAITTSPSWIAESNQDEAYLGVSVGTAGDVNGDGFSDVIVGAYLYDNGETDEGRVFVYHGSAAGLATSPAWTAESNQADAWFGNSVAFAGDVNGDGPTRCQKEKWEESGANMEPSNIANASGTT